MKTCICTIIKNEHQYLDEWIQYHIHLGIDHIFIFEDLDSESHEGISSKYSQVTLMPISNILTEGFLKLSQRWKRTKESNPQIIYIKNALLFIQKNHDYDWCFVIDNDEFVTCDSLEELNKYIDYDAVVMSWKCYGASEHVNKPDYLRKGMIDTYTKEIAGVIPTKTMASYTKTCYNLHTYKNEFFWYTHQPSDKCNWCRTDYSKDRFKVIYDNIYIRHYITKSWEEYVWKLNNRGFLFGKIRNDEFFFQVNSDLKSRQKELMEVFNDEVLVILPYKQSGSQGNELDISLLLWRKYCKFNYHFIVIGDYDKSLINRFPWVEFIPYLSKSSSINQYNPHLDMQAKMRFIIEKYRNKYDGFIWMVDDNYAIKPFTLFDILQTHYHSKSFVGDKNAPTNYWRHDKWKTRQLLDKENLPHINYTTHFPCWFDFDKLIFIMNKYGMINESYVLEDIYFNYYDHESPIIDDDIRLGIWNNNIYKNQFSKALLNPNIKFVCNSTDGWSKSLEQSLRKLL